MQPLPQPQQGLLELKLTRLIASSDGSIIKRWHSLRMPQPWWKWNVTWGRETALARHSCFTHQRVLANFLALKLTCARLHTSCLGYPPPTTTTTTQRGAPRPRGRALHSMPPRRWRLHPCPRTPSDSSSPLTRCSAGGKLYEKFTSQLRWSPSGAERGVAVCRLTGRGGGIPARNTEPLMCDFIFRHRIYYSSARQRAASRWTAPSLRHTLDAADCPAKELDGW